MARERRGAEGVKGREKKIPCRSVTRLVNHKVCPAYLTRETCVAAKS